MLEHSEKNDKLVRQLREYEKKSREATATDEKERFSKLAREKHDEILMEEMGGDRNIKRFQF